MLNCGIDTHYHSQRIEMKRYILLTIVLLMMIFIAACGGEAPLAATEAVQPTQTESQPTQTVPVPTDTSAPVTEEVVSEAATEAPAADTSTTAGVSYANDVYPIFEASCIKCHGVDSTKEGLDLLTYDTLLAGSRNGTVLVPGNAGESLLVELIVEGEMPNRGPGLSAVQIQTITDWVNQGALNN